MCKVYVAARQGDFDQMVYYYAKAREKIIRKCGLRKTKKSRVKCTEHLGRLVDLFCFQVFQFDVGIAVKNIITPYHRYQGDGRDFRWGYSRQPSPKGLFHVQPKPSKIYAVDKNRSRFDRFTSTHMNRYNSNEYDQMHEQFKEQLKDFVTKQKSPLAWVVMSLLYDPARLAMLTAKKPVSWHDVFARVCQYSQTTRKYRGLRDNQLWFKIVAQHIKGRFEVPRNSGDVFRRYLGKDEEYIDFFGKYAWY